jgi:hypothetical protein
MLRARQIDLTIMISRAALGTDETPRCAALLDVGSESEDQNDDSAVVQATLGHGWCQIPPPSCGASNQHRYVTRAACQLVKTDYMPQL